jgi:hypothetical protein
MREIVVLLLMAVFLCLVEKFQRAVQTAMPLHLRVDGRMVGKILAVIDGGLLDFPDGLIDFVDGDPLVPLPLGIAGLAFDVRPGVAKVLEGMEIGRVFAWLLRMQSQGSKDHGDAGHDRKENGPFHTGSMRENCVSGKHELYGG